MFKVNLNKGCPFWGDDAGCVLKDCHVSECQKVILLKKNTFF